MLHIRGKGIGFKVEGSRHLGPRYSEQLPSRPLNLRFCKGIIICPARRGLDLTFGSMGREPSWEDSEVF